MRVLHIVPWAPEPLQHGGMRRTAQVEGWLGQQSGVQVTRWTAAASGLGGIFTAPMWTARTLASGLRGLGGLSWKGRAKLLRVVPALALALRNHQPDVVLVETAPHYSLLVALLLAELRLPYVVAPHNIESLVPGAVHSDFASRGSMLDVEAKIATRARSFLAISPLDHGLLQTLGGRGEYFPYYPTAPEVRRFEGIRVRRDVTEKRGVLVLGSVSNQPTLEGMRRLASELAAVSPFPGEPVQLAGYRTEQLQNSATTGVEILGTVSVAALDQLLAQVRCVVLRQPFTTGGLTRLVELNLCGVPVVMAGNYLQARGQEAYGIYARANLPSHAEFAQLTSQPERLRYQPPSLELASLLKAN